MTQEFVLYERSEWVGIVTLNRPKALNALNSAVIAELSAMLDNIEASDVRCLIINGAGEKAFVAGADVEEMRRLTPEQAKTFSETGNALMGKLERFPVPTIAAVGGYALGGGLELALACDIRISADSAVYGMPETSLGILPGYGGVQRLVRTIGVSKAKKLVFTCERLSAEAAYGLGLVDAVVTSENLLKASFELAEKISANAPAGVKAAKLVANRSIGMPSEEAYCLESEYFAGCFCTIDQRMAMDAFVEKKKPGPFTGE